MDDTIQYDIPSFNDAIEKIRDSLKDMEDAGDKIDLSVESLRASFNTKGSAKLYTNLENFVSKRDSSLLSVFRENIKDKIATLENVLKVINNMDDRG